MDDWYYKSLGEQFGPVSFDKLVELAKNQILSSGDEVRFGANGSWRRAGSMGQLMAHMPAGSHLPKSNSNSSVEIDTMQPQSWHYKLFGDEFGPVPFETLVELVRNQTLANDDEVRSGSQGDWCRADSVPQLQSFLPALTATPVTTSVPMSSSAGSAQRDGGGWYYKLFGEQFGPVSFEDLVELAKNHTLSVGDDVRFGDSGPWRRAGSIGKLMAHLPFQEAKNSFSVSLEQRPAPVRQSVGRVSETSRTRNVAPPEPEPEQDLETSFPLVEEESAVEEVEALVEEKPVVEDKWWCTIRGKEYGPVPLSKLMEWVANGRLVREDYVRQGFNAYVIAGDLPGLFPELPKAAAVETKAEFKAISSTRVMPAASSAPSAPVEPVRPPSEASVPSSPSTPAGGWQAGARPAVPIRRPPVKSKSSLDKLLVPIIGVVGVVVLGGLIYLILPFLGESADVKRFKLLKAAYAELQNARAADVPPDKDELKKIASKMAKVAKPIETELKGKSGGATVKLRSLAKKMQEVGKADLTKPTDAEKAMNKTVTDLSKQLKIK